MSDTPQWALTKIREAKEKQLKKLDLSYSMFSRSEEEILTKIPAEVFELVQLEILKLYSNRLTTVPDAIVLLQNLIVLDLFDNPLEIPPPEVVAKGLQAIKEYFRQLKATSKELTSNNTHPSRQESDLCLTTIMLKN